MNKLKIQQLRIARPTDQLDAITGFYCNVLGFEVVASFEDPDGYRVVLQNAAWDT